MRNGQWRKLEHSNKRKEYFYYLIRNVDEKNLDWKIRSIPREKDFQMAKGRPNSSIKDLERKKKREKKVGGSEKIDYCAIR